MSVQLRIRLPALDRLQATAEVDWAQVSKGQVIAGGRERLETLGTRFARADVSASLDAHDLILLELTLPPLSGRRLQTALQGEVEAMLLDDLQDVALACSPQSRDGRVSVTWLGVQAIARAQGVLQGCGLRLAGLYPTPLLLPFSEGQATLQACGEHLLVRAGRDRGFVQWRSSRDTATVLDAVAARLQASGVSAVKWVGAVPQGWPAALPSSVIAERLQDSGEAPAWSLPLPQGAARAPKLAFGLAMVAMLLAALGLQLQVMRWRSEGEALRDGMAQQFNRGFPEITDVVDPVLQARRALAVPPPARPLPEVQQQVAALLQAVPELAGRVQAMEYQPGQLKVQLEGDAAQLASDAQRQERWRQAALQNGLSLAADADGQLRVHNGAGR